MAALEAMTRLRHAMGAHMTASTSVRYRPILRSLALAGLSAMLTLPTGCSKPEQAKQAATGQAAEASPLPVAAETFRLLGAAALLKGLQGYGTPETNLRFKALADDFIATPDWQAGWQLFLSTAITAVARADSARPLVGYYHPASDTMLLTAWQKQGDGTWRVASVDVLPGTLVRGAKPPFNLGRTWQQQTVYPPEALAQLTAQTMQAFSGSFTAGDADPLAALPADMRQGLPTLAAVPFAQFRAELIPLYTQQPDSQAILALWTELRGSAESGKTARTGDIAQSVAALGKLSPKVRASLTPVAFISAEQTQVLMLTSQVNPNLTVALQAERNGTEADPRRLDLISYQAFAEAAAKGGTQ